MPRGHAGILVDDTGVNNIFLEGYVALKKIILGPSRHLCPEALLGGRELPHVVTSDASAHCACPSPEEDAAAQLGQGFCPAPAPLGGDPSRFNGRCPHTGILTFPPGHLIKVIYSRCGKSEKLEREESPFPTPLENLYFTEFLCTSKPFCCPQNLNFVRRGVHARFVFGALSSPLT